MIDLKQLEYFICCVQNGSISKAARQLYTSQPHVSEVIKKLEQELSTVLFLRSPSGIRLTQSGQQVYEYAQNILKEYRLMELSCRKASREELTILSNSSKRMGAFFTQFYLKHREEGVAFSYLEGGAETIMKALHDNRAELGFLFFPEAKQTTMDFFCRQYHLRYEILTDADMVLYAGQDNPLCKKEYVTYEEMKQLSYVQMEEDYFGLDDLLSRILPVSGQASRIVTTNSNNGMLHLLKHTDLCNLGSYWKKDFYTYTDIRLIPIKDYKKKIFFAAVFRDADALSGLALAYLNEVKAALAEEEGQTAGGKPIGAKPG